MNDAKTIARHPSIRAAWTAAPQDHNAASGIFPPPAPLGLQDQTVRQVVRVSAGGRHVRVRLSNLFGRRPLTLQAVQVAASAGGSAIDSRTSTTMSFAGQATVTVAPGREIWSDWQPFELTRQSDMTVSMHVLDPTGVDTVHSIGLQTGYVTPGNTVSVPEMIQPQEIGAYYWLTGVDVMDEAGGPVIVAIGDSLTDGFMSTPNSNCRYPNLLAQRLAASGMPQASVVNAGISGNRLLTDRIGPSVLSRFERDALGQSGVSHVVALIGNNDIGFGGFFPDQAVTAPQIQAGLAGLVGKARDAGVKIFLGTLAPFGGFREPYVRPGADGTRQAVNAWIRSNAAGADGIVDVDAMLRDPEAPTRLLPSYDSGDHAHPNDAGYAAIANGIDLSIFASVAPATPTASPTTAC
jgi:lysophospholipase L1-like esterase